MNLIKRIVWNLTPPIVINFRNRILRNMPTSVNRETNDKHDILELKKKYETDFAKESIIIGNGPSLKLFLENHINFIERKTIFCINSFATSIYFELIKSIQNVNTLIY